MPKKTLIAVAAEDDRGLEGEVSAHFGRCPHYVLASVEDDQIIHAEVVPNPHFGAHQPGLMPEFIAGLGANVIIAGGMGPRAVNMFHGFGMDVATGAVGRVGDIVEAYLRGEHRGVVPCAHDHPESCTNHGASLGADRGSVGASRGMGMGRGRGRGMGMAAGTGAGQRLATARGAENEKAPGMAPGSTKVVITVHRDGDGLSATVDARFGRAERFLLVDSATGEVLEAIDNPSIDAAHGAGTSAAGIVGSAGAGTVISGRFGPKASQALQAFGIDMRMAPENISAEQALQLLRDGKLEVGG